MTARDPTTRLAAAIIAGFIAILLGAGLWVRFVYDPTPGPHRITVAAAPANDGVVAFHLDRFPESPTPVAEIVRSAGWTERPAGVLTLASGRGRASYEGSVDDVVRVVFRTGPEGGRARLIVDGVEGPVVALPRATSGELVERVRFDSTVPPASWALLVLMILVSFVPAGAATWGVLQVARAHGRRAAAGAVGAAAAVGALTAVVVSSQPSVLRAADLDAIDQALRVLNRVGLALAVGVAVVLVACVALGVRAPRVEVAEPAGTRDRWELTLLLASVPFAGSLALHLLFWPGLMNPDMAVQWFELDRTGLDDWHPYLTSVVVGGLRHLVDSPALPVLLQVTGASLLVGRLAAWTVWRGRSPWVAAATLALLPLIPVTGLFTVTLWKDTAFGLALLGLALVVWRVEDTDGRWLEQPRNVALAVLTMSGLWLTRHNGWPVVVGTLVVLLVAHRRCWKPIGAAAGATVVVALLVQLPLADALDVRANRVSSIVYVQHIANHVNRGTELTRADRRLLSGIYPLDRTWPYDCHSIQPTWSGRGAIPLQRFSAKAGELRSLAIDLALRNPGAELDHLACSSTLVWKPWADGDETYLLEWSDTARHIDYIPRIYDDSPPEDPASPRAIARVYDVVVDELPMWLLRPAIYLYALIGAIAFAAWRRRSWGVVRIAVPAIVASVVLAALNLVQDVRFQYGVILTAVVLVPALLTVARRSAAEDVVPLRWGHRRDEEGAPPTTAAPQ